MTGKKKTNRDLNINIKKINVLLNKDESVLITYSPKFKIVKLLVVIISGICIIVAFFLQLIYLGVSESFFFSQEFFIFSMIISIILLFFCGVSSPIFLSKIKLNMSKYIFTNQQLIMKLSSKLYFIPLKNILSMQSIERKDYYFIRISLKKPIQLKNNLKEMEIRIPIVPKDNALLEKIKTLKLGFIE